MDNRETVNAVQRMQAYIEEHLQEPITLHKAGQRGGLFTVAHRKILRH